jgi:hypothetical protein
MQMKVAATGSLTATADLSAAAVPAKKVEVATVTVNNNYPAPERPSESAAMTNRRIQYALGG